MQHKFQVTILDISSDVKLVDKEIDYEMAVEISELVDPPTPYSDTALKGLELALVKIHENDQSHLARLEKVLSQCDKGLITKNELGNILVQMIAESHE